MEAVATPHEVMPYIKPEDRPKFQTLIDAAILVLRKPNGEIPKGEINYLFSKILYELFDDKPSYDRGSDIHGVCHDIAAEFYRRKMAPYEDEKIATNGDI